MDVDVTLFDDQLAILWQPPDRYSDEEMSERTWWPCEFARSWLVNELLPEVRRWVLQREFPSWIGRVTRRKAMTGFEDRLLRLIALRDLRLLPLLQEERLVMPTPDAVERLQSFFNGAKESPHVFVNTVVVETLYSALAMLARLGFGHVPYVVSNLSLREPPKTHAELETAILLSVREHIVVANASVVDCALRATLELMPDDGTLIPPPVDDVLRDALVPLARIHDNAQFARRHQPSIG
jgi:hypothetical protein